MSAWILSGKLTFLLGVINLGARLNQVSDRLRVLPCAVLDKFRKLSMSNYNVNDGGIGFLDYETKSNVMQTQTIRLDTLPSFDILFHPRKNSLYNSVDEINAKYAAAINAATTEATSATKPNIDQALLFRQPIHFLKIDVEGFELQALDSASELFNAGLVEHCVLEFGPPNRWDVTLENAHDMSEEEKRKITKNHAKRVLHRAVTDWNMDIYLLPAIGWDRTVEWMIDHNEDYGKKPHENRVVHYLKSWDFDGKPKDGDEFEAELDNKQQVVTEIVKLPPRLIDEYMEDLDKIGEMYLWFAKRNGNPAVLRKLEIGRKSQTEM